MMIRLFIVTLLVFLSSAAMADDRQACVQTEMDRRQKEISQEALKTVEKIKTTPLDEADIVAFRRGTETHCINLAKCAFGDKPSEEKTRQVTDCIAREERPVQSLDTKADWMACLHEQAKQLDDGTSPTNVIGDAVQKKCADAEEDFVRSRLQEKLSELEIQNTRKNMKSFFITTAAWVVLEERNKSKVKP